MAAEWNNKALSTPGQAMGNEWQEVERREGWVGMLQAGWTKATKGTVVSSIFILLTTCVGAGTLSLPYAFSQGGIFVFSILFFLIMVRYRHCSVSEERV